MGKEPNKTFKNKNISIEIKNGGLNSWLHKDEQKVINLEELCWMCPKRQGDGNYERDVKKYRWGNDKI